MLFNIGDLVTRKSHNNDIIFKILKIEDRIVYLKGKDIRLYADSYIEDLVISKNEFIDKEDELLKVREKITLDRSEYFYLPGKILHIDGDKEYLDRCRKRGNKANFERWKSCSFIRRCGLW